MSRYSLLQKPNPILKQVCQQITFPLPAQTEQNIQRLKSAFRESFITQKKRTLGLAAPQIGVLQRFFIMPKSLNLPDKNFALLQSMIRNFNVYINPKILQLNPKQVKIIQNCLSIGNECYEVQRSQTIKVQYYNMKNQRIEETLTGMRARVFLHENDHLDGITMDQKGRLLSQEQVLKIKVSQLTGQTLQQVHQNFANKNNKI